MPGADNEMVLIVEDDVSLANGLGHNLRFEGYDVRVAMDGKAGLEMALRYDPDLIVLDLMLPGLPGMEVLRRLRQQGSEAQVIILSAREGETDKVEGLRLGADDYVTKPFSLQELLARVEAALRRPRKRRHAMAEERLVIGDVELWPARREARRQGEELSLTAKELDLLVFLARRPQRAFSREQLLQEIWGDDYDGTARTVDNFIRRLRTKIEPTPEQPVHLETVHGVGYKLVP
ncbi:MAG: response regulator transcription factor [Polyangia bacterium]|jgi:DNA-binding response OmpR family regulator|nr:response regulator transcription factor [Polyangia bacterium]